MSLTPPSDPSDEARGDAPGGNPSANVADGLRQRVLSDRLARYLRELDAEYGPLTDEDMEAARREWHGEG